MEAGSSYLGLDKRKGLKFLFVIAVLSLPVVFGAVASYIGTLAYNHSWFFMERELPSVLTAVLFPVAWIFLWLNISQPKKARLFAVITAVILLLACSVSTAIETGRFPLLSKIDRELVIPEDWVKKDKVDDARSKFEVPEERVWQKQSYTPVTLQDLEKIAADNDLKDYEVSEDCGKVYAYTGCQLSGNINGMKVAVSYYGSARPDSDQIWTLRFRVAEFLPEGFRKIDRFHEADW